MESSNRKPNDAEKPASAICPRGYRTKICCTGKMRASKSTIRDITKRTVDIANIYLRHGCIRTWREEFDTWKHRGRERSWNEQLLQPAVFKKDWLISVFLIEETAHVKRLPKCLCTRAFFTSLFKWRRYYCAFLFETSRIVIITHFFVCMMWKPRNTIKSNPI